MILRQLEYLLAELFLKIQIENELLFFSFELFLNSGKVLKDLQYIVYIHYKFNIFCLFMGASRRREMLSKKLSRRRLGVLRRVFQSTLGLRSDRVSDSCFFSGDDVMCLAVLFTNNFA